MTHLPRTCIVTGAASGIGAELALSLAKRGDRVCAADLHGAGLKKLQEYGFGDHLLIHTLDVRHPEQWQSMVQLVEAKWGKIDYLYNVAGILRDNWFKDTSAEDVDLHFDVNVKGCIFGMQAVLPGMLRHQQGHIINIASLAGLAPVPGLSLYSASKFAVRGFSLATAMELAPSKIAVTVVCPDAVQTPMLDQQKDHMQAALTFSGLRSLDVSEVVDVLINDIPKKRPMEVIIPQWRGLVAKAASHAPEFSVHALTFMQKMGQKRQQKLKKSPQDVRT